MCPVECFAHQRSICVCSGQVSCRLRRASGQHLCVCSGRVSCRVRRASAHAASALRACDLPCALWRLLHADCGAHQRRRHQRGHQPQWLHPGCPERGVRTAACASAGEQTCTHTCAHIHCVTHLRMGAHTGAHVCKKLRTLVSAHTRAHTQAYASTQIHTDACKHMRMHQNHSAELIHAHTCLAYTPNTYIQAHTHTHLRAQHT